MKLLILLLSLLIGIQSQTLEEVNKQIQAVLQEIDDVQDTINEYLESTINEEESAKQIEGLIFAARNESADFENRVKNVSQELTSCRTALSACLEKDEKTKLSEKRLDEVKQEQERLRSELKALEDEQKNHTAKLENLNLQSNEIDNNSKLLEAELQELRLNLSKCLQELKNHKKTNQSRVNKKTDGGGFIITIVTSTPNTVNQLKKSVEKTGGGGFITKKIVTSTPNNVKQLKKSVEKTGGGGFIKKIVTSALNKIKQLRKSAANALRSGLNWLKFNIPE